MATKKIAKIALEEAFNLPDIDNSNNNFTAPNGAKDLGAQLVDIHEQRLKGMDENGVSYMILSLTAPGPQGETNPEAAQALAERANNYLAVEIGKNPARFGGFAALSMHDPKSAALEARRAIKELGFHGLLVNDFQSTGADGEGAIFYDQPEWDIFWEEVQALDVPFYIHPRLTTPAVTKLFLDGRPWLRGATYFFSVGRVTPSLD
jgi:2,3-dihydroxybenzoate decarboxylase